MGRQIFVSSAYKAILVPGETHYVISLINKINNVGPIIDPCGTPEITGLYEEHSLPITTRCDLFLSN